MPRFIPIKHGNLTHYIDLGKVHRISETKFIDGPLSVDIYFASPQESGGKLNLTAEVATAFLEVLRQHYVHDEHSISVATEDSPAPQTPATASGGRPVAGKAHAW